MILHTGDNHELELEGEEESCFPSALSFAFLAIEFIVLIYRVYRVAIRYFAQPTSRNKSIKIPALSLIVISIWMVQDIPIEFFECNLPCPANAEKACFLGICVCSFLNYRMMGLKFRQVVQKSPFLRNPTLLFLHKVFQGLAVLYLGWACLTAFVFASTNGECGSLHVPLVCGLVLMTLDLVISFVGLYLFSVPVYKIHTNALVAAKAPLANAPGSAGQSSRVSGSGCVMVYRKRFSSSDSSGQNEAKSRNEISSIVFWNLVGVAAGQVSTQLIMIIFTFFCTNEDTMGYVEATAPFLNVIAVSIMFRDHIHAFNKITSKQICGTHTFAKMKKKWNINHKRTQAILHMDTEGFEKRKVYLSNLNISKQSSQTNFVQVHDRHGE
mmetsp:Transcript_6299/g.9568  ORF Transcript_6299/g.9568 Transcript_6299/m.9568 type:complete len:383 (-) Transcript_6299:151-1299(-)